jgi:hypothetical protein
VDAVPERQMRLLCAADVELVRPIDVSAWLLSTITHSTCEG